MEDLDRGALEPVAVKTTAEEVHRQLKQAILDGDLSPGARLIERHLAEQLEVSRTPVREALKSLMNEGLVMVDGHRGLMVARLSVENVEHAYALRETLEGLAARLAAGHRRPDLLEKLSSALKRMEHRQVDVATFDLAHSEFHDTIVEMSGNPYLMQALKALEGFRTRMVSLNWVTKQRVQSSVPEHRRIFEAIELRDGSLAERCAAEHVHSTRDGLIRRLQGLMDGRSKPVSNDKEDIDGT